MVADVLVGCQGDAQALPFKEEEWSTALRSTLARSDCRLVLSKPSAPAKLRELCLAAGGCQRGLLVESLSQPVYDDLFARVE